MGDAPDPVPEDLPIVVSVNADRMSAVARLVLGAVAVLALAGAVALPAHDLLLGTTIPRPRDEYMVVATAGGLVALVAGLWWRMARPMSWTIDAGGITQDGPGGRRCDLRWADVRRVLRGVNGYEFYGRVGVTPVRLPREAIPKGRRAPVLAGVEAVLREHFNFPPPLTGGIWRALAVLFALLAVAYGTPCLYLVLFLLPLVKSRPQTIMDWGWVRRLIAWNVDAASALVPLILLAPALASPCIAVWLVWLMSRKTIRDRQIVPKRIAALNQRKTPRSPQFTISILMYLVLFFAFFYWLLLPWMRSEEHAGWHRVVAVFAFPLVLIAWGLWGAREEGQLWFPWEKRSDQ